MPVLTTFQGFHHDIDDSRQELWHEGKEIGYYDLTGIHFISQLNTIFHGSHRVSSESANGSAQSIPATYGFGEMWELRYNSSKSDNTQFQGMFMEVRTLIANSSTVRGMEVIAAQGAAVAVGGLEGGNFKAHVRSATTGNITFAYGLSGEFGHNSNAYTGTVADVAAVRGKVTMEDGATYTKSAVFLAHAEGLSGSDILGSILRGEVNANITVDTLIDMTDVTLSTVDTDKVNLIRFKDSGGDEVILRVDDSGTVTIASAA
jgi:hypothetical protein